MSQMPKTISFYDKDIKPYTNNASLKIDKNSYKLLKRPIELNELTCICGAFSEDINPTFLVVEDNDGNYIYGSLAGIPELNKENKTEITGTDIKSMLSSDVILDQTSFASVNAALQYIFGQWNTQVNQGSFNCELVYTNDVGTIVVDNNGLIPIYVKGKYDALEEMQSLMRFYKLYLDTKLDIVNKKIQFIIGRTMLTPAKVKLWEYGIKNYGKWVADVNECQGYLVTTENDVETWSDTGSIRWILTASGNVTTSSSNRDIFPIKRKIVTSNENMTDANMLALETLLDKAYNEDIELQTTELKPNFETLFEVYTERGHGKYKDLPCGELQYNASGLVKFKIGYRYTSVNFI